MRCKPAQRAIGAHPDGAFPVGQRGRLEEHLERCPECREALARMKRLGEVLAASPVPEAPARLNEIVMERARRELSCRRLALERPRRPDSAWVARAAALLVGLSLGALLGMSAWRGATSGEAVAAYGLDWLGGSPPGSIEGGYIAMASQDGRE